jgi:CDP-glucose 4,6-dehydratase
VEYPLSTVENLDLSMSDLNVTSGLDVGPGFFRGRRVFLTGHTGFKGTWLLYWLHRLGAVVHGYSLAPSASGSLFDSISAQEFCEHQIGDIRDARALSAAVRNFRPEIVLHLAAQALVLDSYEEPIATLETNVMGTAHLLEALRGLTSVRSVVVVTSDKCYRNLDEVRAFIESDPLGGHDPYSASKACTELVASSYRDSFLKKEGIALATARAGNVFGGGDWGKYRIVPDAMRAFSKGEALLLRHPGAVRPWQHVLEPLSGYLMLARALVESPERYADAWNFGPDGSQIISVEEVSRALAAAWGAGASVEVPSASQGPKEAQMLMVDAQKARRELGWDSLLPHDKALSWTVEWHRAHASGAGPLELRSILEKQIDAYCQLGTRE